MRETDKKIVIVMPAYNVASSVSDVFARIPADFLPMVSEFIVVNDGSKDHTNDVLRALQKNYSNITIVEKKINEGYSNAQKTGFRMALDHGADVVVLLHSDGQYAPEELPSLVDPLLSGEADIVQGSRILGGGALKGGMPLYKYVANLVLSKMENFSYGMKLHEYHSGYMLYSRKALETIPWEKLSDTFHFDGEMLFVGNDYGLRIREIGIPTRYAEEKSNLKPIKYGFDVLRIIMRYKLGKYNFERD